MDSVVKSPLKQCFSHWTNFRSFSPLFLAKGGVFGVLPRNVNSILFGLFEIYFWIFWLQSTWLTPPFATDLNAKKDVRNLKGVWGGFHDAFENLDLISVVIRGEINVYSFISTELRRFSWWNPPCPLTLPEKNIT